MILASALATLTLLAVPPTPDLCESRMRAQDSNVVIRNSDLAPYLAIKAKSRIQTDGLFYNVAHAPRIELPSEKSPKNTGLVASGGVEIYPLIAATQATKVWIYHPDARAVAVHMIIRAVAQTRPAGPAQFEESLKLIEDSNRVRDARRLLLSIGDSILTENLIRLAKNSRLSRHLPSRLWKDKTDFDYVMNLFSENRIQLQLGSHFNPDLFPSIAASINDSSIKIGNVYLGAEINLGNFLRDDRPNWIGPGLIGLTPSFTETLKMIDALIPDLSSEDLEVRTAAAGRLTSLIAAMQVQIAFLQMSENKWNTLFATNLPALPYSPDAVVLTNDSEIFDFMGFPPPQDSSQSAVPVNALVNGELRPFPDYLGAFLERRLNTIARLLEFYTGP